MLRNLRPDQGIRGVLYFRVLFHLERRWTSCISVSVTDPAAGLCTPVLVSPKCSIALAPVGPMTMSLLWRARSSPVRSKVRNARWTPSAAEGEIEWSFPRNTNNVGQVKGGALDGSSCTCHVFNNFQDPGRLRLQEGWKYCREDRVSPARLRDSPSSHKFSK